jgi:hypothetical protein
MAGGLAGLADLEVSGGHCVRFCSHGDGRTGGIGWLGGVGVSLCEDLFARWRVG